MHDSCPEVEETLKWRMPAFVAHGAILCTMTAFRRHAAFGFWPHAEVIGSEPPGDAGDKGMGSFGKPTSVRDLPPLVAPLCKSPGGSIRASAYRSTSSTRNTGYSPKRSSQALCRR